MFKRTMSIRLTQVFVCLLMGILLASNSAVAQNGNASVFVKMEIGAMGLHCPFLGVTLIDQLEADSSYSEVKVDKSDQFLTFSYTAGDLYNVEYFQKIAVNVGYPASLVTITLFGQQPSIEPRD